MRPRLFALLDGRADATLTLITAPAGYGKTELLASWLEHRPDLAAAWVSLDSVDADPLRFWTHVAHSVDRVRRGMARPAFARLQTPGSAIEESIDELMNGIATFAGRLVIAIDDLHHFSSSTQAMSLTYAVDHLPERARIVATTRADPVVRLARLRARNAVADIRAEQLAFSVPEARELVVDRMGVNLATPEVAALVEHTEGWPTGITLAGLWLSESEDPGSQVRSFAGDQQITDYLTDEVLDALDEETRSFMARTSMLDRLCGPLCDAMLETTGSARKLEELSHSVLFLLPLDRRGEWYRYHQLFRDLLALELSREGAHAAAELHRRAAAWFVKHDLIEEALEHAAATDEPEDVAQLLAQEYLSLSRLGRHRTLIRWAQWLPEERLRSYADVAAAAALASAMDGRPADEVWRLLQIADSAAPVKPVRARLRVGTMTSLTRAVSIVDGVQSAIAAARRAVELALEESDELVVGALGALAYALYLQGELDEAADAVHEALARPEAPRRPQGFVVVMACAALIEHDRGHVHIAEAEARRSLEHARRLGLGGSWVAGLARLAMGQALLATGAIAEAERHLERAETLRRAAQPALEHVHTLLVLAEARVGRGRLSLAAAELALALESLDSISDAGRLRARAQRVNALLEEALADTSAAVETPTPAELVVLRLLATDLSQRQIAQELFLSPNTVKTHLRNLYRKLRATSRADAVRRAREVGLLG